MVAFIPIALGLVGLLAGLWILGSSMGWALPNVQVGVGQAHEVGITPFSLAGITIPLSGKLSGYGFFQYGGAAANIGGILDNTAARATQTAITGGAGGASGRSGSGVGA